MTQLQPILLSNAPVQSDRILRSTSGNANFQSEDNFLTLTHQNQLTLDESSENDVETDPSLKSFAVTGPHSYLNGHYSTIHARERAALRSSRRAARRDRQCIVPPGQRLGPTGLPDHLYEATYRHKFTKQIVTGIVQQIPEALAGSGLERYQHYRSRSRKDLGIDGKPVWPDNVEEAFQQAVRLVPPVLAKKKVQVPVVGGTMLMGRNQLVDRVLARLAGVKRTRKQVSSHKQVLRNFIPQPSQAACCDCSESCRILTERSVSRWQRLRNNDPNWEHHADPRTWRWDDENSMLVCVDYIPKRGTLASDFGQRLPTGTVSSLRQQLVREHLLSSLNCVVQKMDFNMSLYSQDNPYSKERSISHTFTTMQSDRGAQPRVLDDVPAWKEYFPRLESMMGDGTLSNCDIIFLDSSLQLMEQHKRPKSFLGIRFDVDVQSKRPYDGYSIESTFYEDRGKEKDIYSKSIHQVCIDPQDPTRARLPDIPLQADWWTKVFGQILECRLQKRDELNKLSTKIKDEPTDNDSSVLTEAKADARAALAQEDENSARYLQEVSVMQELFGYTNGEAGVRHWERVAVFLWRFRRTRNNEFATTTWRRLSQAHSRSGTEHSWTSHAHANNDLASVTLDTPNNMVIHRGSDVDFTSRDPYASQSDWSQHWNHIPWVKSDKAEQSDLPHEEVLRRCYPESSHSRYCPPAWTIPSNDYQDSGYGSQPSSLPSQLSTQNTFSSASETVLASEALSLRIKEHFNQDISDRHSHSINESHYTADVQQQSRGHNCETSNEPHFGFEEYDGRIVAEAVNDPSLLNNFCGSHIHLDLQPSHHALEQAAGEPNFVSSAEHSFTLSSVSPGHNDFSLFDHTQSYSESQLQHVEGNAPYRPQTPEQGRDTRLESSPSSCAHETHQPSQNDCEMYASGESLQSFSQDTQIEETERQYLEHALSCDDYASYKQQEPLPRGSDQDLLMESHLRDKETCSGSPNRSQHQFQYDEGHRMENAHAYQATINQSATVGTSEPATTVAHDYLKTWAKISRDDEDFFRMIYADTSNTSFAQPVLSTLPVRNPQESESTLTKAFASRLIDPLRVAEDIRVGEVTNNYVPSDRYAEQGAVLPDSSRTLTQREEESSNAEYIGRNEDYEDRQMRPEDSAQAHENMVWTTSAEAIIAMHPGIFLDIGAGPGSGPVARQQLQQPSPEGCVLGELPQDSQAEPETEQIGALQGEDHAEATEMSESKQSTDARVDAEALALEDGMGLEL